MRPALWKLFGLKFCLVYTFLEAVELIPGGVYRLQLQDGTIVEEAIFVRKKSEKRGELIYYFKKPDGEEFSLQQFSVLPVENPAEKGTKPRFFYDLAFGLNYPLNQKELDFQFGYPLRMAVHFKPFKDIPWLFFSLSGGYFYLTGKKALLYGPELSLALSYLHALSSRWAFLSQVQGGVGFYELKNLSLNQKFPQNSAIFLLQNGLYYRIFNKGGVVFRLGPSFLYDEKRPLWLINGSLAFVYGELL